ncbi:MAG: SPOR domain-containing protein [Gammaproteobacteria bacterium]|nr:SPOR domain-containing protein [Gammaproteobacteria bacterium]
MERAIKERLVGASLLILAAVIIVPWLLDGPEQTSRETTELQLPGAGAVQTETRTIVLDGTVPGGSGVSRGAMVNETPRDRAPTSAKNVDIKAAQSDPSDTVAEKGSSSPPATTAKTDTTASASDAALPDPMQAAAALPPAEFTQPVETDEESGSDAVSLPVTTAASGPGWAVQVGSFALQENAERLADRLKNKGYGAFVMRNVVDGRVRYRVRVGATKERPEADELAAALRADRQPARVVTHP